MRFIVANPHIHVHYGRAVSKTLTGQKSQLKYSYLWKYWLNRHDRQIAFFIDGTRSSFNEIGIRFRIWPRFFSYTELLIWMLINKINPFKYRVFFNIKKLNPKEDIIFNFSFTTIDTFARNNNDLQFHKYNGLIITHLTHYFKDPSTISNYLKKIKYSFLVAENDLTANNYFRYHFPNISSVYQLPFTYAERFKNLKEFSNRQNKCFGIGTFSSPKAKDFLAFFKDGTNLQPMRKAIYQHQAELKSLIDCFMCDYDNMRSLKAPSSDDTLLTRLAKKYLPYFMLYKILPNYQSQYFNFNIVEKYNNYKMFVCPEEIVGLPSTNVFEGMACGCVFFGIDDPMYANLGMRDGINYVSYKNDSIDDLVDKISFYQKNPEKLEQISKNGVEFIAQFSPEKIAEIFWKDLEKLLDSFNKGAPIFSCSFKK